MERGGVMVKILVPGKLLAHARVAGVGLQLKVIDGREFGETGWTSGLTGEQGTETNRARGQLRRGGCLCCGTYAVRLCRRYSGRPVSTAAELMLGAGGGRGDEKQETQP